MKTYVSLHENFNIHKGSYRCDKIKTLQAGMALDVLKSLPNSNGLSRYTIAIKGVLHEFSYY